MKYVYILLSLLLILLSCNTNKLLFDTKYKYLSFGKSIGGATYSFEFYKDSTFKFWYDSWVSPCNKYHSMGQWRISNSTLILNSNSISSDIKIDTEYSYEKIFEKSICIDINNGSKEYSSLIFINDSSMPFTARKQGTYCYFTNNTNIDSLSVIISKMPKYIDNCIGCNNECVYFSVNTSKIYLNNDDWNRVYIKISVPDSLFSFWIFENTKLKIKENKLIMNNGVKYAAPARATL